MWVILVMYFIYFTNYNTLYENFELSPIASNRYTPDAPVQSLPIDIPTRYKNTYYYEFENDEFIDKLTKIFIKDCQANQANQQLQWVDEVNLMADPLDKLDHPITEYLKATPITYFPLKEYEQAVSYVTSTMKLPESQALFKVCANKEPVQLVHDKFIGYAKSKTDPKNIRIHVEFVFYRLGAYHGKHVGFQILVTPTKTSVIALWMIGVVFSEQLRMFPYEGTSPLPYAAADQTQPLAKKG